MTRSQTANLSGTVMTPAVRGLSSSEAQRRLAQTGPNELRREQAASRVVLLARQFASPVIWLLAGAAVVNLLLLFNLSIPLSPVGETDGQATSVGTLGPVMVFGTGWTTGDATLTGLTAPTPSGGVVNTMRG